MTKNVFNFEFWHENSNILASFRIFLSHLKRCGGFVSKKRMKNNHAPPVKLKDYWQ